MTGEQTDHFMHTRLGRLQGLEMHARQYPQLPGMLDLASRIRAALSTSSGKAELAFIQEFHDALVAAGAPEGLAWTRWERVRAAASRAATAHDANVPWMNFYASDHSAVFLENLNACMRTMRADPPVPYRMHVLMSSLTQIHGLLDNYLWKQVFAPLKKLPPPHDAAAENVHKFLDLAWSSEPPLPLSDLRDGWNHGRTELHEDHVIVLDRDTHAVAATLSVPMLERYVLLGKATWTAIQLDIAFGAATREANEGKPITLSPLPERLRQKRKQ